ncbi:MAG: low molecular weight protein tyrosine phosphatase family protein [Gemmobacter sp.]
MIRALFLCGKARMRSPTAAAVAADWPGVETDFAGLSHDADERVSIEQVLWADVILVMEARQARRLRSLFPAALRGKRVVVLDIPDRFGFMDPDLVALVSPRLRAALRP